MTTRTGEDSGPLRRQRRERRRRRRRTWRRLTGFVRGIVLLVGWILFLAALGLFLLEESGFLTRAVKDVVARELGPLGPHVEIESVRLNWFEPGLELAGITFDGEPDGEDGWREGPERLRISSAHVLLDRNLDRSRLVERVTIRGGRVVLSDALLQATQSLLAERRDEPEGANFPVSVSGIEVGLETPGQAGLELGSTDFQIDEDASGRFRLRGRLNPTLAGAVAAPVGVHIRGDAWRETGISLDASVHALALDSRRVQEGDLAALPWVEEALESFRGQLTLVASARFHPDPAHPAEAEVRIEVSDADVAPVGQPPLEDASLRLDARFREAPGLALWDVDAWSLTAHATGRWNRSDAEIWALVGGAADPDALVETWLRIDELIIDEETLAVVEGIHPKVGREVGQQFAVYAPRGVVRSGVNLTLARGPAGTGLAGGILRASADVTSDGRAQCTFFGPPDENGEPRGFPVPCTDVRGRIIYSLDQGDPRDSLLAFVGMTGDHGSGAVFGDGLLWARRPEDRRTNETLDIDFAIRVPSIDVDETLARGLAGMPSTRDVWATYSPSGGTVSASWHLRQRPELEGLTGHALIDVHGVRGRWNRIPVPLENTSGRLELRWARESALVEGSNPLKPRKRRPVGVRWEMETDPSRGVRARVTGLVRAERYPDVVPLGWEPPKPIQDVRVELEELLLRGSDWELLVAEFDELGEWVAGFNAQGGIGADFHGSVPYPGAPYRYEVEATPAAGALQVAVTPSMFRRQVRELTGRVLLRGVETAPDESAVETLFAVWGTWPGRVALASSGRVPPAGTWRAEVSGAGVDFSNPTLKGALVSAFAEEEDGGDTAMLSDIRVAGRLDFGWDFEGPVVTDPEDPAAKPDMTLRVFLRDNRFATEDLELDALHGVLTSRDGVWRSPAIEASLVGTPIQLRNVLFLSLEDAFTLEDADPLLRRSGFMTEEEGTVLQADWSAENIPLDREHLAAFVEAEGLDRAFEVLRPGGRLDVGDARLIVVNERDGRGKVALHGRATLRGVELSTGLPIELEVADVQVESLVLEAGRLRGWWKVSDLDATVAGRRLEDASLIATFVDGRLTVDNLRGTFEGGDVSSLGGVEGADSAVAVDLSDPFSFAVGLRLMNVDVERLMGGVFDSSVEDAGRLHTTLRLQGVGGDVLALQGDGEVFLTDARLWSIPVMRELFRNLGSEGTAIFDRMEGRWQLEDGVFLLSDLRVRSPILNLVGAGHVDLDGSLRCDLEVRYTLLDRLGSLNRVLYWLNNSLWRVALRGDLARPEVVVRNSFREAFLGFDDEVSRRLPLPGWSPLPPIF